MSDETTAADGEKAFRLDLSSLAKASCKKCFGRGFTSINKATKQINLCRCTAKRVREQVELMRRKRAEEHAKHCDCPSCESQQLPVHTDDKGAAVSNASQRES